MHLTTPFRAALLPLLLFMAVSPLYPSLTPPTGTDPAPLLRAAREAEAAFDVATALELYLRADRTRPDDPAILQKISRQYSDLTIDTPDPVMKQHLCTEALAYAQRAVALDSDNAVNVLSLAICYGKLALYADTRARIEYSRLVRRYAGQALRLNPDYDYAHHVLGRWHCEVARLGVGQRLVVRLIYGGLPAASTAEAVQHLRRAVELAPAVPSHHVELGFALLADGQPAAARAAFAHALNLPAREKHDEDAHRRAREALAPP